jgi:glucokinase
MPSILVADIGGTNSRFAAFEVHADDRLEFLASKWFATGESRSFHDLLKRLENENFELPPSRADVAVFGVAGPVEKETYSKPPHIDWDIDLSVLSGRLRIERCVLINDFVAQAFACRSPVTDTVHPLVSGEIEPSAPLAVIGAGTGLGQAALIPLKEGGYVALASEGGHASFAFESNSEIAYMEFLLEETGESYVRAEMVVSGAGLSHLHRFLTGQRLDPADVAAQLTSNSETLRWMARFYGRLSRNLALQVVALGGVYIAGGVAAKNPDLVSHPEFARAFRQTETMSHVLDRIPVFLNTNEESGLWGAALRGVQLLKAD